MRLELKLRRVELDKSVLWTQPMVIPISPRLMSQQFELMLGESFHDKSIGFCYIRESRALNSSSRVHSLSLSAVIFLHHPTLTVWDTETVSILQSPNLNYTCRTTKTAETETQSLMTLIQNGYLSLATPSSPTAGDFFSHHQHLYPSGKTYYYWKKRVLWNRQSWNELLILIISGSQNFFPSPAKGQDFHLKSTEALINSETSTFRSENVSFSSLEVSHMIIISQSEASILVTWALSASQRQATWSHDHSQPIRSENVPGGEGQ